jgi:hypothetical protein
MKNHSGLHLLCIVILIFSCNTNKKVITTLKPKKVWNFDDLDQWQYASQLSDGKINYGLENGNLRLFSNANTRERTKIKTVEKFTTGIYTWRIFVPAIGVGDQTAIGAYLYKDDKHELDFEIGYGTKTDRAKLNATDDELIVHMTSQDHPHVSTNAKIKREKWYSFSITLENVEGRYKATWKIDNQKLQTTQLTYGQATRFKIFCSVENLSFIGDHIPTQNNYALFDSVTFQKQ